MHEVSDIFDNQLKIGDYVVYAFHSWHPVKSGKRVPLLFIGHIQRLLDNNQAQVWDAQTVRTHICQGMGMMLLENYHE